MPRTKAQIEASARKGARTRKANEAIALKSKESSARKRKSTMKKKGLMGDILTPAAAQGALKTSVKAGIGGSLAVLAEQMLTKDFAVKENRIPLAIIIGGTVASAMGNPSVGNGAVGYGFGLLFKKLITKKETTTMQDDMLYLQDNAYVNNIQNLPAALDSSGVPMADENNNMYLQDDGYQVPYAPDFGAAMG